MDTTLTVAKRAPRALLDETRFIKAVLYGRRFPSTPIQVDRAAFEKCYKHAGASTILTLEGLDEPVEVLVQDLAVTPLKGHITHVDFYAIERGKALTATVPLNFTGTPAAADQGGILNKVLHELEVSCRPSDLPHDITVDVSGLAEIGAQLTIADLSLPAGVTSTHDAQDIVAQIAPPTDEAGEAQDTEPDMAAIEVEGEAAASNEHSSTA